MSLICPRCGGEVGIGPPNKRYCSKRCQHADNQQRLRIKTPDKHRAAVKKWENKNREKYLAYQQKYNMEHIEARKASATLAKRRYAERGAEYNRQWRKANPEWIAAYQQLYQFKNADKLRSNARRRHTTKRVRELLRGLPEP